MPRETMTPRERWLAVLTHKTPDRVPMDYWATDEVTERLAAHLGCAGRWEMFERLHIDAELRVAPRYAGPPLPAGVDNQFTLPFGSPAGVRAEVLDNLRILGAGGGYILAPCHNLQPITPAENILAMYEAGYEYGWS